MRMDIVETRVDWIQKAHLDNVEVQVAELRARLEKAEDQHTKQKTPVEQTPAVQETGQKGCPEEVQTRQAEHEAQFEDMRALVATLQAQVEALTSAKQQAAGDHIRKQAPSKEDKQKKAKVHLVFSVANQQPLSTRNFIIL